MKPDFRAYEIYVYNEATSQTVNITNMIGYCEKPF